MRNDTIDHTCDAIIVSNEVIGSKPRKTNDATRAIVEY